MMTRPHLCAEIALSRWSEYFQRPQFTSKALGSIRQIRGDDGFQMGNRMLSLQIHKTDSAHHWERTLLRWMLRKSCQAQMNQQYISELLAQAESLLGFVKSELASSEVNATPQSKKEGCQ